MTHALAHQYVFDNDGDHSADQHRCLADLLDPLTFARLAQTGVQDGWNCLEIGAGGGSVARWLADRAAPRGHVFATDIKPGLIPPHDGLTVTKHDIVHDPLPEAAFDLVHARLVLSHLTERTAVLQAAARRAEAGRLAADRRDRRDPLARPDGARPHGQGALRDVPARDGLGAGRRGQRPDVGALGRAGDRRRPGSPRSTRGATSRCGGRSRRAWSCSPATASTWRTTSWPPASTKDQLDEVRSVMADPGFRAVSFTVHSVLARRPEET